MVDLSAVERFEWDDGNARKSEEKQGVSQNEAEQIFANTPLSTVADDRHSAQERRFQALGRTDSGRRLFVSFTLRDEGRVIRAISARDISRRERTIYEAET
jgi:uncharacterized DUF497 family protein